MNKKLVKWFMENIENFLSGHDQTMDYYFKLAKNSKSIKVYERTGYVTDKDGNDILDKKGQFIEKKPKYLFSISITL